jgi:diguanylate cyclase (GGDEF)-like protein
LIGEQFVALRTIDPSEPGTAIIVSSAGVPDGSLLGQRIKVGEGVGGRAIAEGRLIVVHEYRDSPDALPGYPERSVEAAMAAPVHENGAVVGSLLVASNQPGRRYSAAEQQTLLSFADHVSLALTDATTTESLRRALDDARHDAMHDELTGLPNRALLRDRLGQAWARGRRSKIPIALLFLDFDNFKDINDSLGHDAGDQLLGSLARRFVDVLRPGDTIARLGGDEFAVLIENLEHPRAAEAVAGRLLAALTEPVLLNRREVTISGSIGIAISDFDEPDSRSLLYSADLAMYEAKRGGGGRHVTYQPAMHHQTVERLDTEQALKRAIAVGELVLHYQPILDLRSGRIVAAEALVRWEHPTRGLLGPAEFVPLAESSRLINALGEWVLRTACAEAANWPSGVEIAVNVSPKQVEPGLPQLVRSVLSASRLRSDRLTLEVTESIAMTDEPETLLVIAELHDMGVHLAIDDFGTGYSSLARLRTLPVDQLKIDKSFIDALDSDPGNAALISAIVALCRGSRLTTVAEGVETEQQLARLVELGCDRAQGYLFSRPVDAQSIAAELDRAMVAALLG